MVIVLPFVAWNTGEIVVVDTRRYIEVLSIKPSDYAVLSTVISAVPMASRHDDSAYHPVTTSSVESP